MSNKDLAIQLINQMPDYKLGYVIAYLQGLCATEIVVPTESKQTNETEIK